MEGRIYDNAAAMRDFTRAQRRAGMRVALVPTMGSLHEGHLSLVTIARQHADVVVVSIYVNPTQFAGNEDFGVYPKSLAEDHAKLARLGVEAVFQPRSLYGEAGDAAMVSGSGGAAAADSHETFVTVERLQRPLCGQSRPHFFRGVATVVAKLLNIVEPDVAVFGTKDFQQLRVIQRMVRDLDFGVQIVGGPIAREADGLAMSSRNLLLAPEHRAQAPCIHRALQAARAGVQDGSVTQAAAIEAGFRERLAGTEGRIDYAQVVDADSLAAVTDAAAQPSMLAVAVFFGSVRLIDNIALS